MIYDHPPLHRSHLRRAITEHFRADEATCLQPLLEEARFSPDASQRIRQTAKKLVLAVRQSRKNQGGMDAFMDQYDLSTQEGVALMCLAEALLRIPDSQTKDELIRDKLTSAEWDRHLGKSHSLFVNASTWGLMLTGELLERPSNTLWRTLKGWFSKSTQPIIRTAIDQAMKILGQQFVMGETIEEAIQRAKVKEEKGYRFSYDMLGEAAYTQADADRYFKAYEKAIAVIATATRSTLYDSAGISIKLSALHPRYEVSHRETCVPALAARLLTLCQQAKAANINLTVDAEEMDRLELSLDIIETVFSDASLEGWEGFGLAVQAYQKRCPYVLAFLIDIAKRANKKMMIRLVKGAYWDTDIKDAQVRGLESYAVYTRKASTDISYIACAKQLAEAGSLIYPQFATHNAQTVATIMEIMKGRNDFEFQCLQGMGAPLYDHIVGSEHFSIPARVYAPVGNHKDLLPYLVRRLLENGANTSFVNRIINEDVDVDELIQDPVMVVEHYTSIPHPQIPLPENIYPSGRKNSHGLDLTNELTVGALKKAMDAFEKKLYKAAPSTGKAKGNAIKIYAPRCHNEQVGEALFSTLEEVEVALEKAKNAYLEWDARPVEERASYLEKIGELLEKHHAELMSLIVREAGRTIPDALSEVREAVDFCRYYAQLAREQLQPHPLAGYTGETNELHMHGRGTFLCISPWNFPVAIFTGQIVSALVTGNCVIAKPAEPTSLIGCRVVELMHEAGIPKEVLHVLPGKGSVIGAKCTADLRISGVLFTGGTDTARSINQTLAKREGPIVPFIAETGGQNAMIVDSTTLAEQVVRDAMQSAFGSCGQRCSALRVLFLQDDIADRTIEMLRGAMKELVVGDPGLLSTDIGPVIKEEALQGLKAHVNEMDQKGQLIGQISHNVLAPQGCYFEPCAYEIPSIDILKQEVFGPILHVIRFKREHLDRVIESINHTGYGLTFGLQTRISERVQAIQSQIHAGNIYVNRTTIGAVVGVQPFGGEGLSGTGPKAGGPHFLARLCHERVVTINTVATGGNTQLMSLQE